MALAGSAKTRTLRQQRRQGSNEQGCSNHQNQRKGDLTRENDLAKPEPGESAGPLPERGNQRSTPGLHGRRKTGEDAGSHTDQERKKQQPRELDVI